MHMADALLSPPVAAAMYAASGAAACACVKVLRKDENTVKLPAMAVTSALVFAGQMVNYAIPGTGSSGHLCGGMMLSALLGPQAGFLSMTVILTIQCLFFADGGLLALGANCWNMAFYGCFAGYYLLWRPIMRGRWFSRMEESRSARLKIILASVLGCVLTLQLGALSVVLETTLSGVTELPLAAFARVMQPIHLAIGLVEGGITAAVLLFVHEARPQLLMEGETSSSRSRCSPRAALTVLAVTALVVGGGMSLAASSAPDGLEWSLFGSDRGANMGLDEENYGIPSAAAAAAGAIQEKTALLPDYAFPDSESPVGTSVSGMAGSVVVAAAAAGICLTGGFFRRKKAGKSDEM